MMLCYCRVATLHGVGLMVVLLSVEPTVTCETRYVVSHNIDLNVRCSSTLHCFNQ